MTNTISAIQQAQVSTTNLQNAESGFVASDILRDSLQSVLVDLIALSFSGKQIHWNVVGPNFRDLHHNFDDVVEIAREGSDTIAERMRALHVAPDGRTDVVAATTTLPGLPAGEILSSDAVDLAVKSIEATTRTIREVHDAVDAADPSTADLLHELINSLEQQAWFIAAEKRQPQA